MNVTIEVTAGDIARGKPCDAFDCPVWHAVARALPRLLELDPGFSVGPFGLCCYAALASPVEFPQAVCDFMERFDNGLCVEPFTFVLDVPGELIPQEVTA